MSRVRIVGVLALMAGAAWVFWPESGPPDEGTRWLENRAWADHFPTSKKDVGRWFTPLHLARKRFGVLQAASHFQFSGERFLWKMTGKKRMQVYFQQSGRKTALDIRTWQCAETAPKPFELCMELRRGKRSVTLYSKKAWTFPREKPAMEPLIALPRAPWAPEDATIPHGESQAVHPLLIELGL